MDQNEFEQLVAKEFERLPERFRKKIRNVAFLVEDEPSDEVLREAGLGEGETLLGFYHGIPNTVRGGEYGVGPTLPDSISIYKLPTEDEARECLGHSAHYQDEVFKETVRTIVAETVWHEVAHYFGFEEEEVERREEERKNI